VIPDGMHDVLPVEAADLRTLEDTLRARFAAHGYGEVRTPALEFAATIEAPGEDTLAAGYRLFDASGQVLMLRTDMTVPVARLAADRLRERPLPLRLWYLAPAFRPAASQRGQEGEVLQAGIELLALDGPAADAEVVTLLCDALAATGLRGFRVALGSVVFWRELVAALDLPGDERDDLFEALAVRDYPVIETIVAHSRLDADDRRALQQALALDDDEGALDQARRLASTAGIQSALEHLEKVRGLVAEAGFGAALRLDFALFPDLGYYTGVAFEAYADGVSLPIAAGGRYDDLVATFGWDVSGAGFAIGVDRLHLALAEQDEATAAAKGST